MYGEREIVAYKSYFWDFMATLTESGFQKKTQKTPVKEINKALKLKEEYYGSKSEKR